MKKLIYTIIAILVSGSLIIAQSPKKNLNNVEQEILKKLDGQNGKIFEYCPKNLELAELGYQEEKVRLYYKYIKEAGFQIEVGVADIPTAFLASYGSGHPIIGILGEYDALPGISQEAIPERKA